MINDIFVGDNDHGDKLVKSIEQLEKKMHDKGMRRCGLCGCWDRPVNHHNDCSVCARAQYGD